MQWKQHAVIVTCALMLAASPLCAKAKSSPYVVEVWSDVLFDPSGQVAEFQVADENELPSAFADQVKARLQKARIEPRSVSGKAVSFRTGVGMAFEVTPGKNGGSVRVVGLEMAPRPLKRSFASFPTDIARVADWSGSVTAVCQVSTAGKCSSTDVEALPGLPESARRWAAETFRLWSFVPQQLDGAPVEGEYRLVVSLQTEGPAREDFREDKFERLMRAK